MSKNLIMFYEITRVYVFTKEKYVLLNAIDVAIKTQVKADFSHPRILQLLQYNVPNFSVA